MQLTAAYRSLSRPSSAPDAKASSLRPLSLDLSVKLENYASHFGILRNHIFTHSNLDVPQFLFVFLYALLALYRIFVIQFSRCGRPFGLRAFKSSARCSLHKQHTQPLMGLVGPSGLEPPTLRLSVVRSNQLSYGPIYGGDNRDRTDDPLLAKQVLSQLSYTPISEVYPLN